MSILVNAQFNNQNAYKDPTNYDINTTYHLGDGDHKIKTSGNNIEINTGEGDSIISHTGNDGRIYTGDGDSIISYTGNDSRIYTGNGDNKITAVGNNMDITTKNGNNIITLIGKESTIETGQGNQTIKAIGDNNTITTKDGDDDILFLGNNCTIDLGNGNNNLTFYGKNNTINCGDGNDNIISFDKVCRENQNKRFFDAFLDMLTATEKTSLTLNGKTLMITPTGQIYYEKATADDKENFEEYEVFTTMAVSGVQSNVIKMGKGTNNIEVTLGKGNAFYGTTSRTYDSAWNIIRCDYEKDEDKE